MTRCYVLRKLLQRGGEGLRGGRGLHPGSLQLLQRYQRQLEGKQRLSALVRVDAGASKHVADTTRVGVIQRAAEQVATDEPVERDVGELGPILRGVADVGRLDAGQDARCRF